MFSSLINRIIILLQQKCTLEWTLIFGVVWYLFYCSYKTLCQVILKRMNVKKSHQNILIAVNWNFTFFLMAVLFVIKSLSLSLGDFNTSTVYAIEHNIENWYRKEIASFMQTKLSFVILAGYYLNSTVLLILYKNFNSELISNLLFSIFFLSSYFSRCIYFGLAAVGLDSVSKLGLELSRLFNILGLVSQSSVFEKLSYIAFGLHSFLWCCVYLNIFPRQLISTAWWSQCAPDTWLPASKCLALALSAYYVIQLYNCPFTTALNKIMRRKYISLYDLLFDEREEHINNGNVSKLNSNCSQDTIAFLRENSSKEENHGGERKEKQIDREKTRENLRILYQNVKCYLLLKRKIKRMRSEKETKRE